MLSAPAPYPSAHTAQSCLVVKRRNSGTGSWGASGRKAVVVSAQKSPFNQPGIKYGRGQFQPVVWYDVQRNANTLSLTWSGVSCQTVVARAPHPRGTGTGVGVAARVDHLRIIA